MTHQYVKLIDGVVDCVSNTQKPAADGWIEVAPDTVFAGFTSPDGVNFFPTVPVLQDVRAGAFLSRRDFCLSLATHGVLTASDAIEAARGGWPAAMDGFLAYLDETQTMDAQIEWAAAATLARTHIFVLSLASWLGMTDEEVDSLFGITPPT